MRRRKRIEEGEGTGVDPTNVNIPADMFKEVPAPGPATEMTGEKKMTFHQFNISKEIELL